MRLAVLFVGACGFGGPALTGDAAVAPDALGHRATLTIHHEQVTGGPHAQFPLLVALADPDLALHAADTGFDLVFTDASGTPLAYERELYTPGNLVAWVAVPLLRGDVDTMIYLFYGDRLATIDHQDPVHVWDAGYAGVWHLAEAAGGAGAILDSTSHHSDATDEGGPVLGAPGIFGHAVAFDGVDDALRVSQHASLDPATSTGTLSLWVDFTLSGRGTNQRLLMSENTFANDFTGMELATNGAGDYYYYPARAGSASNPDGAMHPFTDNVWHQVAIAQDFGTKTIAMYVDGALLQLGAAGAPATWTVPASPGDWYWGGAPTRALFLGSMDEIRVSTSVRSADWIATEYANQHAPGAFYALEL